MQPPPRWRPPQPFNQDPLCFGTRIGRLRFHHQVIVMQRQPSVEPRTMGAFRATSPGGDAPEAFPAAGSAPGGVWVGPGQPSLAIAGDACRTEVRLEGHRTVAGPDGAPASRGRRPVVVVHEGPDGFADRASDHRFLEPVEPAQPFARGRQRERGRVRPRAQPATQPQGPGRPAAQPEGSRPFGPQTPPRRPHRRQRFRRILAFPLPTSSATTD